MTGPKQVSGITWLLLEMEKEHQITTKWKNEKQPIYINIDIFMSGSMFIHICIYSSLTVQILKREFQTEE